MKKGLCVFLLFCILTVSLFALTEGNYEINQDGVLKVLDRSKITGEVEIPSHIGGIPVKTIGAYAFNECKNLEKIIIPATVSIIEREAFNGCRKLSTVEIKGSITYIGSSAFYKCSNIKKVYVSNIADWCNIAFNDCYANPLCYGDVDLYVGNKLLTGLLEIPSGVTTIHVAAFYNYKAITGLIIPDSVTSIEEEAFLYCTGLKDVRLSESITSIGESAFYKCSSISKIVIPNSVTSIGKSAFEGCTSLKSITLSNSLTSVGRNAFKECPNYKTVYISDLSAWCQIAFENSSANPVSPLDNFFVGDQILKGSIDIPSGITSIHAFSFYLFRNITEVHIPNTVTQIETGAFYGCEGLTYIIIPDSVQSISNLAFNACENLKSISIGNSVEEIGKDAFYGCYSLNSVYVSSMSAWCRIQFVNAYSNPLWVARNLYIGNESVQQKTGSYIIPSDVTSIPSATFFYCTGLEEITIPDSVTHFGSSAFKGCSNLKSIVFMGSKGQWISIDKDNDWSEVIPQSCVVHCTDGNLPINM